MVIVEPKLATVVEVIESTLLAAALMVSATSTKVKLQVYKGAGLPIVGFWL